MIINESHVHLIAEKYKLNKNNFVFIEKKNFLKKKFFIIYKPHDFFFELNKKGEDLNNFFPFFSKKKEYTNFEIWCDSIKNTLIKSNKIVKSLIDSKPLRDKFKKEYKV